MTRSRGGTSTRITRHATVTLLSAAATALAIATPPGPVTWGQVAKAARNFEFSSPSIGGGPSPLLPRIGVEPPLEAQPSTVEHSSEPWSIRSARTLTPVLELLPAWPGPRDQFPHRSDQVEESSADSDPGWLAGSMPDADGATPVLALALDSDQPWADELAAVLPPELSRPLFHFRWPLQGEITTYFAEVGPLSPRGHAGLDIASVWGSPVRAVEEGRVVVVALDGVYGWHIVVDHGNAFTSMYAHLSDYDVDEGQWVARGELIGFVGSTGFSTGPHLHLELRQDGKLKDPLAFLP